MKSKLIAGVLFVFLFAVPFRMLYLDDQPVDSGKSIFLLLSCVIGFSSLSGLVRMSRSTGRRKKQLPNARRRRKKIRWKNPRCSLFENRKRITN